MTIKEARIEFCERLAELYSAREAESMFYLLAEDLGFTKTRLILNADEELSAEQKEWFEQCSQRLQNAEPVQYVRGKADFFGLDFEVNPAVLIPRPETEVLVQTIITDYKNSSPRIVDFGTGSGCIAISLAQNLPNAHVSAVDVSPEALQVARQNARNLEANVQFFLGDMLNEQFTSQFAGVEVIVSNPPYVCNSEKSQMRPNVLNFEPHLALFVPDENPLKFYRQLAQIAKKSLVLGGKVYCEINESFGNETMQLFKSLGFINCAIIKDLFGKDRIVRAER